MFSSKSSFPTGARFRPTSPTTTATISAGRFGAILREQLEVSRAEFWEAIRSGEPVNRPVAVDEEQTVEHGPWVIEVLVGKLYMGPEEIENLSEQEAIDLVHEFWPRGRP
jgi:hypothetical protein